MNERGMIWYILALVGLIFVYVWVSKLKKIEEKIEEKLLFKASFKEDKITFLEGKECATHVNLDYPVTLFFDLKAFKFRSKKDYQVFVEGKHKIVDVLSDESNSFIEVYEDEVTIKFVDNR